MCPRRLIRAPKRTLGNPAGVIDEADGIHVGLPSTSQITKPAAIHADFRVEFAADPLAPTGEKTADSEKVSPSAGQLVPG